MITQRPEDLLEQLRHVRRIQALTERVDRDRHRKIARTYADDPVAFVMDCIRWDEGEGLAPYQEAALAALPIEKRVSLRAMRGAGKTMPAALAVHWFALTRDIGEDWKVPTTAGSWRQLIKFLWPEIHRWSRRLNWPKLGRDQYTRTELLTLNMKLQTGEAFAVASDVPDYLEGAHAPSLFAVVDEGKAVPDASYDAIEGYFSDPGEKLAFTMSTPGAPIGRFFEIQTQVPGYEDWHPIAVDIEDAIAAGRIERQWVDDRARQWGEDSALFRSQVRGEFASDPDSAIPIQWVEAAQERWRDLEEAGELNALRLDTVGVDVADTGDDDSCIALLRGGRVLERLIFSSSSGQAGDGVIETARKVIETVREPCVVNVDTIGVGAGVAGYLRTQKTPFRVEPWNAASGTEWTDHTGELRFANLRAAGWWNLRDMLHPDFGVDMALPPDSRLIGELTAPRWLPAGTGGVMRLESKAQVISRLGRSTDAADAVVMAAWPTPKRSRWAAI